MSRRKIIDIDESKCNGCGQCVPACAEGALQIIAGKAKLVADSYCDGLGACLGECPVGAIRIIEREADHFNETLVENVKKIPSNSQSNANLLHLSSLPIAPHPSVIGSCLSLVGSHSGCPGMGMQSLITPAKGEMDGGQRHSAEELEKEEASELTNWPIQLHLVPPHAPFLRKADLLLAADCVPAAMPNFQRRFLRGCPLLIGCPKLDDMRAYVEKLAAIFRVAQPRSLTVVHMEVPCCMALMHIAAEARMLANSHISIKEAIISRRGKVLKSD